MGWFRRSWGKARKKALVSRENREVPAEVVTHLDHFIATHPGVEAWVEPPTTVSSPSVLLVALSGEWTRRTVPSDAWARHYLAKNGVTTYDAGLVSYPQRMRDWDLRQSRQPDNYDPHLQIDY